MPRVDDPDYWQKSAVFWRERTDVWMGRAFTYLYISIVSVIFNIVIFNIVVMLYWR